jgi:hypothetical protein
MILFSKLIKNKVASNCPSKKYNILTTSPAKDTKNAIQFSSKTRTNKQNPYKSNK